MGNNFTLDSFLDLLNPARTLPKDVEDEQSTNITLPPSDTMGVNLDNPAMPEQIQQMPIQKLSSQQPTVNSDMLKNITSVSPARSPSAIEPKVAKPETAGYSKPTTPKERVDMDLGLKEKNIDAPAFSKSQYGEDLSDTALKRAQGESEQNRINAMIALAGNQMNQAFSGVKVDNTAIDEFLKTVNTGEKNIEARRAGKDQELNRLLKSYEAASEKERSDPKSQISQSHRDMYKKWTGKELGKNVSARESKDMLALAEKSYAADMAARSAAEGRQDKKDLKERLSDKQTSDISSFDKAIGAIDDVIAQKGKWDTGKASFAMNKVAGWVGMDDAEKSAFKANVGEQLAAYIKSISGATVSPTERAALLENVPSVYDNDATFTEKANALKVRIQKARGIELSSFKKQGKNTSNWDSETDRTPGNTKPVAHAQDKAAVTWAKANPKDPRSKAILQANGVK